MGAAPSQISTQKSVTNAMSKIITTSLQSATNTTTFNQSLNIDCSEMVKINQQQIACVKDLAIGTNRSTSDIVGLCQIVKGCGAEGITLNSVIKVNLTSAELIEVKTKVDNDLATKLTAELEQENGNTLFNADQISHVEALTTVTSDFFNENVQALLGSLVGSQTINLNGPGLTKFVTFDLTADMFSAQFLGAQQIQEALNTVSTDIDSNLSQKNEMSNVMKWVLIIMGSLIGLVILFFVIRFLVNSRSSKTKNGKASKGKKITVNIQ
jgi:predicted metal-binding transcription factor (methanogenesis marker protein 9)